MASRRLVNAITRFITLPGDVIGAMSDLLEGNDDAVMLEPRGPRFGSVYTMRPGSPLLEALAATPVSPGVSAHSIIAVTGAGPGPEASDGVVDLESARLDGVTSELVIPFANHSVQRHPLAIREVRRILLEHAAAVCRTSGVACGTSDAARPGAPPRAARGRKRVDRAPAVR